MVVMSVLLILMSFFIVIVWPLPGKPLKESPIRIALAVTEPLISFGGLAAMAYFYLFEKAFNSNTHWGSGEWGVALTLLILGLIGVLATVGPRHPWVRIAGWWLSFPISLTLAEILSFSGGFNPAPLVYAGLVALAWRALIVAWKRKSAACQVTSP